MNITVTKTEYGDSFDVMVGDVTRTTVKEIRDLVDLEMGLAIRRDPVSPYVDLSTMDYQQQEALRIAAKLHYDHYIDTSFQPTAHSKIHTIKFIRSLTSTATLVQTKHLVDYALGGEKPTWFKNDPVIDGLGGSR